MQRPTEFQLSKVPVYTIGHGGLSVTGAVELLKGERVQYVVDVRSKPYSRYQREFCRRDLSPALAKHTIRYVYMGDLLGGRPKDPDCYTAGHVDYKKYQSKPFFGVGISRLQRAVDQGLRVCLLCSEGDPARCHRSKLVGVALEERGIDVRHILTDGTIAAQLDVMNNLANVQPSLFEDDSYSREKYV